MFVLSGFIAAFLAIILIFYYKYFHRMVTLSMKFPGPPALPLIGNGLIFVGSKPEDGIKILINLRNKYGERFRLWLGPKLNVHTINVQDAEELLSNSKLTEKAGQYRALHPWLREGLLVSKKQKWFKRRKTITPAFHFQILEQFVEVFDNQSSVLIENLSKIENKNQIDLYPFISLYTLDVICETAMGVKINAQKKSDSDYVKAIKTLSTILYKRMTNAFFTNDFIFYLTPEARQQKKYLKVLHDFSEGVIIARRDELLKHQNGKSINNQKKKMAFLDILLQSKIDNEPLSNLDIREEVDTFMFEGHDTTSSAIHFLLYYLARHPDAQRKCYEEICEVLDDNKPITYQDLQRLRYVELCIKETLRLCPSVPLFGRTIDKECTINGNIYPAGTNIGIGVLGLGRIDYLFPRPNEFIPERFNDETSADKLNPFAFIPFSAGPRNCIGQKFAILEIKSVVSNILRNFELEYVGDSDELEFTFELILKSLNILWFKLKPRHVV